MRNFCLLVEPSDCFEGDARAEQKAAADDLEHPGRLDCDRMQDSCPQGEGAVELEQAPAAELMPRGTMYAVAITCTAIPCAASETSSSFAAITVTIPKAARPV